MNDISSQSIKEFLNEIAAPTPIPSGGATVGLTGALAASLGEMLCNLSIVNKKYEKFKEINQKLEELLKSAQEVYFKLIQTDSLAFLMLKDSYGLPEETEAEKKLKNHRIIESTIRANEPPIEIIKLGSKLTTTLKQLTLTSIKTAISDIGVCATLLNSTIKSSWLTILINKRSLQNSDPSYSKTIKEIEILKDKTLDKLDKLYQEIENELN